MECVSVATALRHRFLHNFYVFSIQRKIEERSRLRNDGISDHPALAYQSL
ncbi:MAG: hypothetical protein ACYTXI_33220 [Nostoc sp.]